MLEESVSAGEELEGKRREEKWSAVRMEAERWKEGRDGRGEGRVVWRTRKGRRGRSGKTQQSDELVQPHGRKLVDWGAV